MSQVDKLQEAEEHVAQMREEAERAERSALTEDLRRSPLAATADRPHRVVSAPLSAVRTMANMREGALPDLHELAVSIKETGLLHPPLVRETGDADVPYELLAGRRRFGAMQLLEEAEGERSEWRFTVVEGITRREALTMQFAENFHQSKPEPVAFARAARRIMAEDDALTAAEVSRLVGAPASWTRKALRLLELPESIVERVEAGDLSFTSADLVRRGIARGDVSADDAASLVEQHAAGELSGAALKHGVGYVPPPPDNYDALSRGLDEVRFRPARDPDERNDDASPDFAPSQTPGRLRAAESAPTHPRHLVAEELDAYLLGVFLARAASDHRRAVLRIHSEADAHTYALSLRPTERLAALRSLAAEVIADDPGAPAVYRAAA